MYSPVNNYKNKNINPYNLITNKSPKRQIIKDNLNNSMGTKKLILSRNNFHNKNFILKTKNNNSYKKFILNRQLSSDNSSPVHIDKRQNNTTTNINTTNSKNINKKGQILIYKKNDNNDINNDTLYKYLIAKINDNNHLYNKNNNFSNNLDFSMNILINNNQKNENNVNNNNLNKNNEKKNNKNYYQRVLNFPLSPINKSIKAIKLNNLNLNDFSSSSLKHINTNNKEIIDKRILSSKKNSINKDIKSKINEINNQIKIENSYIYHNTNNINLNVNIINKKIINNPNEKGSTSLSKLNIKNQDLMHDSSTKDIFKNKKKHNKIKSNENENSIYNYSIGNLTSRVKHTAIKIKPINYNVNNNDLFNLSSNFNVINKDKNMCAEEIHFRAVKYIQEIKKIDKNF